jgi:hypothetical protein
MLDKSENQRLHERIAEVAAFIPGLGTPSTPPRQGDAAPAECSSFSKQKIERILERVYERLGNEASEVGDPRLRELLAEAVAQRDLVSAAFSEGKTQRILARLEARLAAIPFDEAQVTAT